MISLKSPNSLIDEVTGDAFMNCGLAPIIVAILGNFFVKFKVNDL